MLKITQQAENPEIVRVSLSGYFTGEYVPEVEKVLSNKCYFRRSPRDGISPCCPLAENQARQCSFLGQALD
jgi:hypothetical protein